MWGRSKEGVDSCIWSDGRTHNLGRLKWLVMNRFKVINGYIVQERGCILYHKSADEFVSVFHLSHCVEATAAAAVCLETTTVFSTFQLFSQNSISTFCLSALRFLSSHLCAFHAFTSCLLVLLHLFTCASLSSQVSVWRFNASCDCCGFLFSLSTWGDIVSHF